MQGTRHYFVLKHLKRGWMRYKKGFLPCFRYEYQECQTGKLQKSEQPGENRFNANFHQDNDS